MPPLKRKIGDLVLASGEPGKITGFWEDDPEGVTFPYYVDLVDGPSRQLYAERELTDLPVSGSPDVWQAMAFSYWEKWRDTRKELQELKAKIRRLSEDADA